LVACIPVSCRTTMIRWDTCKKDFQNDGSLRDIYITPATLADWRAIYPLLHANPGVEYSVDGIVQSPPDSVEQIFAVRPAGSPTLRFHVGQTLVVFHFFWDEEIECDFYPKDISSQVDLEVLLAFIRRLGDATCKRVIITPESFREHPFITYDPAKKEFVHHEVTT